MTALRMGTRGSALALAQSRWVASALERRLPGLRVEEVVVKTRGDLFGAPTPQEARALPQGAKGLWVKEIEEALLSGRIDFAVHSAKDLPAALASGLAVAAYPEREDPRDALVCRSGLSWTSLGAGSRVGTSSLRRRLMLEAAKPGLSCVVLRGNVDTRLRRLAAGDLDGVLLAEAGLRRLGLGGVARELLEPERIIPAPGQGALALEARVDRADVAAALSALEDAPTRLCVETERAFLAALDGGCGSPVGAWARPVEGGLRLDGFFALEGENAGRRVSGVCPASASRADFARALAARARER